MNNLLAQINVLPQGEFANLGSEQITIGSIVGALITIVLIVAAVIFFFMLIIGGIKWILSGGDKAQTESARNQVTAAIVGLVIVFAAFAVGRLVQALFGINVFSFDVPTFLGGSVGGGV